MNRLLSHTFKIIILLGLNLYLNQANAIVLFRDSFEDIKIILNDTGITWGGDYQSGNNTTCTSNIASPQDCNQGRDATHNDDSDGHAGFSFTKLDANGTPLTDQSVDYATTPWACVRDNVTGLVWEVKTTDGGIHDKNDTYNWYNTDTATNGGNNGYADADGNICYGYNSADNSTFCNTQAYTARVNTQGLCGQNDWRLPDINELHSIVHQGTYNPAIDTNYFPNTNSSLFWSLTPYANVLNYSWILIFDYGYDGTVIHRSFSHYVRLVRGK